MRKFILLGVLVLFATLAMGPHINTSGRCMTGQDCSLGKGEASSITFDSDGADFTIDTTANEATLTATTTNTAVFMGADAAGAANTTYSTSTTGTLSLDPEGAGDIIIGSADVTTIALTNTGAITVGASTTDSIALVTAGGTVTVDGSVVGQQAVNSMTAGSLVMNTVNLVTASGDYDIPVSTCAAAANVGNWVTVVIEDDTTDISITVNDTDNQIFVPGLDLGADDELDNVKTAAHEGQNITLTCVAVDQWYMTGGVLTLSTSGTIAWADGGTAD